MSPIIGDWKQPFSSSVSALIRQLPVKPRLCLLPAVICFGAHFSDLIMLEWFPFPSPRIKIHSAVFSKFKQLQLSG